MIAALSAGARWIDRITDAIGTAVSWLTTVLVVLVCFNAFTRYELKWSPVSLQELEWHVFALIFLLGAAATLKRDRHVRVDLIYARFGPKGKAWVNLLGSLLFLLPFCGVVIWASIGVVGDSFALREGSPDPGGLPARYILWAAIPVALALLALQGLSLAARSLLVILGHPALDTGRKEGD